jgi:hypothetical protein
MTVSNILTHTGLNCVKKHIPHVFDNQSAIMTTWKDNNRNIFDKTKPDADIAKVA